MLLLLLACAAPGEPEVLLTGWGYAWKELSHRVAYVRIGVEEDTSLALGLVGGDWSTGEAFTDAPTYRVRYQRVTASDLRVVRGTATLLVGPDETGRTTLELDVGGVPEEHALVAVIDGFVIDTDVPQGEGYPAEYDPAHGYASRGFGFALGDVTRDGETASVPVEATIRWGPQDRATMNAALPFAVTGVEVEVAVIAGPSDPELLPVSAGADLPWDPPYTEQEPMVTQAAFGEDGVVGWRRFELRLNDEGPDAGEGDYLRAFGVELAPTAAEEGYAATVTATLSTTSLSEWTDPVVAFEGELARMGAPDLSVEHWLVTGDHPTGLATTGPTAE